MMKIATVVGMMATAVMGHSAMTCVNEKDGNCVIGVRGTREDPRWDGNGRPTCDGAPGNKGTIKQGETIRVTWNARNHAVHNQDPRSVSVKLAKGFGDHDGNAYQEICSGPFINCGNGPNNEMGGSPPCFLDCKMPDNQEPGEYALLWAWDWRHNDGSIYTTCSDITVETNGPPTMPPTNVPPTPPPPTVPGTVISFTENNYRKEAGVGGWGGSCTCPDGQEYQVGDNGDSCGSLACEGGVAGTCERTDSSARNGMKVTCGEKVVTVPSPTVGGSAVNPATTPQIPVIPTYEQNGGAKHAALSVSAGLLAVVLAY